jgi:hypothetical protein
VLPRKVAAAVSVFAVVRSGHAVAAIILVACIPGTIVTLAHLSYADTVAVPVLALVAMIALLALAASRTSRTTLALYVAVGAVANYLFVFGVLAHHPGLLPTALVLVNRPETALVLVGTAGRRPLPAIGWGIAGFLAGLATTGIAELQLGRADPDRQRARHHARQLLRRLPRAFDCAARPAPTRARLPHSCARETQPHRGRAGTEQRAVALLHDTVLNDLALDDQRPGCAGLAHDPSGCATDVTTLAFGRHPPTTSARTASRPERRFAAQPDDPARQ